MVDSDHMTSIPFSGLFLMLAATTTQGNENNILHGTSVAAAKIPRPKKRPGPPKLSSGQEALFGDLQRRRVRKHSIKLSRGIARPFEATPLEFK